MNVPSVSTWNSESHSLIIIIIFSHLASSINQLIHYIVRLTLLCRIRSMDAWPKRKKMPVDMLMLSIFFSSASVLYSMLTVKMLLLLKWSESCLECGNTNIWRLHEPTIRFLLKKEKKNPTKCLFLIKNSWALLFAFQHLAIRPVQLCIWWFCCCRSFGRSVGRLLTSFFLNTGALTSQLPLKAIIVNIDNKDRRFTLLCSFGRWNVYSIRTRNHCLHYCS